MGELSAMDTVRAADKIIHDVGAKWMLDKATWAHGKENGYDNPFAHYFAGRCGVLGDVDADVVYAALGWFAPGLVRPMWEEGVAVAGAREAARGTRSRARTGAGTTSRRTRACASWASGSWRRPRRRGCRCSPGGGPNRSPRTGPRG